MRDPAEGLLLEILSGSLGGRQIDFDPGRVLVGRAADALLRFDPEVDLEVSGRHAELWSEGDRWRVQDLGSTNGTWVNGHQLSSPHLLAEGDELWFGQGGPRARVLRVGDECGVQAPATRGAFAAPGGIDSEPGAPDPGGARPSPRGRGGAGGLGLRIWAAAGVALVLLVVAFLVQRSNRSNWLAERDLLMAQVDSLLARESSLNAAVDAVRREAADSVAQARAEIQRLRDRLQTTEPNSEDAEVEALRRELQEAMVSLEQQQLSAALDVEGIRRRIEPTVAMIWSEWPDGRVTTGTALSIDGEGTLLTSRHVVAPRGGGEGERLAVQFAGSAQVWRAEVLEVHPRVDLAWVRPEGIVGEVPSLEAINSRVDTLPLGAPLAIVGFSLGGRAQTAADGSRPRAIVSTGVLMGTGGDEIRIRGYGAEGASGSPVVDRDGRLVGLVYGGTDEGGSRVLLAVPIRFALESTRSGG